MKALDIISYFDTIRPNSFDYKTKRGWLLTLEKDIREFVSLHSTEPLDTEYENDENPDLFLEKTYRDIYAYYLASMADMTNAEYNLYNVNSTYFNSLFAKWKREHRSRVLPTANSTIKV